MFDRNEDAIRCLNSIYNELRSLRSETSSFVREFESERLSAEFRFALGFIVFFGLLVIASAAAERSHDSIAHLCANTQANQISEEVPRP
jgi:hypothetical protein